MGTNGITKNHLVGATVIFYLYKKNQAKVDEFLRKQGINIKTSSCASLENLDIEDLIAEKSAAESVEEVIVEAE